MVVTLLGWRKENTRSMTFRAHGVYMGKRGLRKWK